MTAISSSLHGGQVSQYYVHCVYRVGADRLVQLKGFRHAAASQHLVEHVPADERHELNGNFEGPIFPSLSWESDIQVHLWAKTKRSADRLMLWTSSTFFNNRRDASFLT